MTWWPVIAAGGVFLALIVLCVLVAVLHEKKGERARKVLRMLLLFLTGACSALIGLHKAGLW